MAHMSKGRTVENERKWQEKSSSPSPSLIDHRLHPHFCFRHFYLSAFCPFNQSRITQITLYTADVLVLLHTNEIVHRDFKFGNILMDENQQCYLADFSTQHKNGTQIQQL